MKAKKQFVYTLELTEIEMDDLYKILSKAYEHNAPYSGPLLKAIEGIRSDDGFRADPTIKPGTLVRY